MFILSSCSSDSQHTTTLKSQSERFFKAEGNTDPDHRAPSQKKGEVVVTFDLLPTKMSFNLPSFPCLVTENNISYYNGWTETYDRKVDGDIWFEPLMDNTNRYSRMWIESQNNARIVVRWRGALCNRGDLVIAHTDVPSGSPYGEGDWFDEWYIIYPDGVHVRKSRVYTYYAPQSKPLSWELYCYFKEPSSDYVHEFQEMLFLGKPGTLPEDDIETEALTLIKMNGYSTKISFKPYPIRFKPTKEELFFAFGEFSDANMFVVNTKSQYRPFTIAREEGVNISPYPPERETRSGIFQSWPQEPEREPGYGGAGLGHIINRTFYQKTENTLTQIYLSGWTKSSTPGEEIVPLARSWLQAPEIKLKDEVSNINCSYDPAQRAYLVNLGQPMKRIEFEIAASESSPLVNPAFLFNNWGTKDAAMEVNGSVIKQGADLRLDFYNTLDLEDNQKWKDVLVVWLKKKSNNPVRVKLLAVD
jgi:hypothetical protein